MNDSYLVLPWFPENESAITLIVQVAYVLSLSKYNKGKKSW